MQFFDKALKAAQAFKAALNDIIVDTQLKQESIAFQCGVKQNTISQWLDPDGDRHMPAFMLFLVDRSIAVPVAKEILKRFNLAVTPVTGVAANGTIVDEVLDLGRVEAAFADLINQADKKKFAVQLDRLKSIVARLEAEGETM